MPGSAVTRDLQLGARGRPVDPAPRLRRALPREPAAREPRGRAGSPGGPCRRHDRRDRDRPRAARRRSGSSSRSARRRRASSGSRRPSRSGSPPSPPGALPLPALLAALTSGPARVIGAQRSLATGRPADLVAFDPAARWTPPATSLASRSTNTPLLGRELPGVVRLTVAAGRSPIGRPSDRA